MKYGNGAMAIINTSFQTTLGNEAVIYGSSGKIAIPTFWKAEKAYLYVDICLSETFSYPFDSNGFEYEIEPVNKCLRDNKLESDVHKISDTINVLKIVDGIRKDWNLSYPNE